MENHTMTRRNMVWNIKLNHIFFSFYELDFDFQAQKRFGLGSCFPQFYQASFFPMIYDQKHISMFVGSHSSPSESGATGHRISVQLVIIISALVSAVVIAAVVVGYMFWLRRKRQQDQARFLRLFEEGDDIEDELGLGTI